jgi:hypothetical protein
MKRISLILMISVALGACSDKEQEARISELEFQLDQCENGAEKLLAKIQIDFEQENLESVKTTFIEIEKGHPESAEYKQAKKIHQQVLKIEDDRTIQAEIIAAKEKAGKLKALKRLRKRNDDVSGIAWYYQPYYRHYNNLNLTSVYMGDNGSKKWLRLKMSYGGDDWIFFDRAYLSYDGNTKQIPFDEYRDKETENDGGEVWEWIDVAVTDDIEMFIREFALSKNAKMRLTGKYTETRTLTYNEKRGILDVLKGYDALKED